MRGFRLLLLVLAFTVAAAAARPVDSTHLKIIVGVTDDTARWTYQMLTPCVPGSGCGVPSAAVRTTCMRFPLWRRAGRDTRCGKVRGASSG